ncbi:hypothetical protein GE061_002462 [Apolygus lucorum]|uniref:Uncharacterized protein n=1 Tax=Apolygus lucorum TaxID=248454 RepID=A0A6A4JFF0_APOLU|nr:hypothetical protein GE061_002462 [Apolygus lucorum]
MPEGYADDLVVVIRAQRMEHLQFKLNQAMRRVMEWMEAHTLSLAIQKTEFVLLTTAQIERSTPMNVDGQEIITSPAIRYLGVMLDRKLSFWRHISGAADKAADIVNELSRLMANLGGLSPAKRKLLMRSAEAIMLYGAEVWGDSLRYQKYRASMEAVQRRGALRLCSAFRTVSGPASQVIAGTIPIYHQALERKRIRMKKD